MEATILAAEANVEARKPSSTSELARDAAGLELVMQMS